MVRLMLNKAGLRVVREGEHDASNSYYNRQAGDAGVGIGRSTLLRVLSLRKLELQRLDLTCGGLNCE